jgi:hypothetical protein
MGKSKFLLRLASISLPAMIAVTVLLGALGLQRTDPQKPSATDSGGDLKDQAADLVEFAAAHMRQHLTEWTEGQMDRVVQAIGDEIQSRRSEPLAPQQTQAFRESFERIVGTVPEGEVTDPQVDRFCVRLRWYVRSFAERQPLTHEQEVLLNRQIDHLVGVARGQFEEYALPVIGQAAVEELVDGVEQGVAQWRKEALFPGLKRPLVEENLQACEERLAELFPGALGEPPPESGELKPAWGGVARYRDALTQTQQKCISSISEADLPAMPADLAQSLPKLGPEVMERARRQIAESEEEWKQRHRATVLQAASQDELEGREKMLFLIRQIFLLQDASQGQYSLAP